MNNKYIFVACAMRREAQMLIDKLSNIKVENIFNYIITFGEIGNKKVIVGISGPGLINMSSLISVICTKYDISHIINIGMVGGYAKDIHKGDIVICNEAVNTNSYKSSSMEKGIDMYKWEFMTFTDGGEDKLTIHNGSKDLIELTKDIDFSKSVIYGRIGSGDVWNNEDEKINMLIDRLGIVVGDMECVSVYKLGEMFNIPTIAIKGVSDSKFNNESYDDSVIPYYSEYAYNFILKI